MRDERDRPSTGWVRSWPEWSPFAAAMWSAVYACLGLWWTLGHEGFPFDAGPSLRIPAAVGAPAVAALGLASTIVALRLAAPIVGPIAGARPGTPARAGLLAWAWAMAAALLVAVPDERALMAVAFAPVFLLGAPFGWPPVPYATAVPWPVMNQFACIVGGFLWGASALAFARRSRDACPACGRDAAGAGWTSPAAAARWGARAALVAAVIPAMYAATRLAWFLGIPLGISDAFLRAGQADGMWRIGGALAAVATAGSVLTLGLVRPWGETFPRPLPWLGGRRVPPALAVVPAAVVAVVVFSAGLGLVRVAVRDGIGVGDWATTGPGLLWPVWGVALGAAALAYHYRRRGRCRRCGRA
jgi:hypothetical protein